MSNIYVLGYYHRHNLGDDLFHYIFKQYFSKHWNGYNLIFANPDDLSIIPDDTKFVICGGGDIINDYFMNKIMKLVANLSCPIYAISVGIPYPKLITRGYMDHFDYIIHRNQSDQDILFMRYGNKRVEYLPDLVFLLPKYVNLDYPSNYLESDENPITKKIGVFLARPIYRKQYKTLYYTIIEKLASLIYKIAKKKIKYSTVCSRNKYKYEVYLIPFCTNEFENEDDRFINQDLYNHITKLEYLPNVHLLNKPLTIDDIIPTFKSFYLTICTRFHAHILSILTKIPFLSIYCTRKVNNLLELCDLTEYAYKMKVDSQTDSPIAIETSVLIDKFQYIVNNYDRYKDKLHQLSQLNQEQSKYIIRRLNNLILYNHKHKSDHYLENLVEIKFHLVASKIIKYLKLDDNYLNDLREHKITIKELYELSKIEKNEECDIKIISCMISFFTLNKKWSQYNYGLEEQIMNQNYNLYDSIKWILFEYSRNHDDVNYLDFDTSLESRKINIDHLGKLSCENSHRSGWTYVIDHLYKYHNPNGIIFDSYLDKTFGWESDFYSNIGYIPFKQKWIGVIHHTPHEFYGINNLVKLFNNAYLIESLSFCSGLIVLSDYLRRWLADKLNQLHFDHIPILKLFHPTEFVPSLFNFDEFYNNHERKVVQIGAWLRNTYAIYQLPTPIGYKKCALKGKCMDNYFPKSDFLKQIKLCLYEIGCNNPDLCTDIFCRHCLNHDLDHDKIKLLENNCNKYLVGLDKSISNEFHSVQIINNLSNFEYDELLTKNIVFINLIDASAVNTIIECIVRDTPILVNPLPAVKEYLGINYPLYYNDYTKALDLLNDMDKIKEAHHYLQKLDKMKFHMYYFLYNLTNSNLYKSIIF